ncbi:tripartite tricarboxylate transporter TctB family protein [Salsuginibacillus kocurii]|uniref:tripartite tricarboxylate transporter TctB family protein n=1 Tax=Salsuginibacillus kocurii TaxID=427078 RepID=UPI0003753833|nr:tripartite tricarboxylate transporter TctB family protein [Salsuginibacillus kocurii]
MKKSHTSIAFNIVFLMIFVWMIIEALNFQEQARYFPFYVGLLACLLMIITIFKEIKDAKKKGPETEKFHNHLGRVIRYAGWLLFFVILIYIFGLIPAITIYLLLFLLLEAEIGWIKSILSTSIGVTVICLLSIYLDLDWPSSLITIF